MLIPRSPISPGRNFPEDVPFARREKFLQQAANFLWDQQSPRLNSFGSPQYFNMTVRHFFEIISRSETVVTFLEPYTPSRTNKGSVKMEDCKDSLSFGERH
jgi:hypothetical protein